MGFFEEIVRRIYVTFRRAQTQVKAEHERYSNLIIVLFYKGKKRRKRREEKKERKNIQRGIYIVNTN
jgi:hypothetical protein